MSDQLHSPESEQIRTLVHTMLEKNSYALLWDFRLIFQPVKENQFKYSRISVKGDFELFDYGVGLYSVHLYVCCDGQAVKDKQENCWNVRLAICCADDGMWGAWSKLTTKTDAQDLLEKMRPWLDKLYILPTEKELNESLRPFGIYGEMEG